MYNEAPKVTLPRWVWHFSTANFFFSIFQKIFLEKKIEKINCFTFFPFFSNIIFFKKVKIFFFRFFFQKCFLKNLILIFQNKAKLVTLCHHLGKARVNRKVDDTIQILQNQHVLYVTMLMYDVIEQQLY